MVKRYKFSDMVYMGKYFVADMIDEKYIYYLCITVLCLATFLLG